MKNVLISLFTFALTLLTTEVGLSIIYPQGIKVAIENIKAFPWLTGDVVNGWKNASGFKTDVLTINTLGMRGSEVSIQKEDNTLRILCLGDSRTFGIWSSATQPFAFDNQYPAELRNLLQAVSPQKNIEVLNLGVIGYTSSHVLRQLNTEVAKFNPDILIIGVGFNDLLKSWDSGMRTQEPDDAILRFGLYNSFETRFTQLILRGVQANPYRPKPFAIRWVELEEYRSNMARIVESAREMHLPLLLIHQPLRALKLGENEPRVGSDDNGMKFFYMATGFNNLAAVHQMFNQYREALFSVARERNTPLLDLNPAFHDKEEQVFDSYDLVHYNPFGAKIVAQSIKEELQRLNWLAL